MVDGMKLLGKSVKCGKKGRKVMLLAQRPKKWGRVAGKDIAKTKEKPNQDEALGHALCRNTTC